MAEDLTPRCWLKSGTLHKSIPNVCQNHYRDPNQRENIMQSLCIIAFQWKAALHYSLVCFLKCSRVNEAKSFLVISVCSLSWTVKSGTCAPPFLTQIWLIWAATTPASWTYGVSIKAEKLVESWPKFHTFPGINKWVRPAVYPPDDGQSTI